MAAGTGLKDTYSIMLSWSLSKTLFGDTDPVNKLININGKTSVKVTGVYEDLPLNSSFHDIRFFSPFQIFVLLNSWIDERDKTDWNNHFLRMYAEIQPNTDFNKVSNAIKDAEMKNLVNFKDEASHKPQIFLEPMSRWHLYPYVRNGHGNEVSGTPLNMVWLVGATGMFVLLLACINFMNLSTARSERRAREVGIRKVIGSMRRQIIFQFFGESFLIVILAFCISLFLVFASLPWFNNLADKQMQWPWSNGWFWLFSAGFIFITGLTAGSYPALYLSSFRPIKVLKGSFRVGRLASIPRKALVVTQFTVSVALIISTIIVYRQIQFGKNRPIGYNREGLLDIEMKSQDFFVNYDLLRSELIKTGAVAGMSESMGAPTELVSNNGGFNWKGKDPNLGTNFGTLAVTQDYGKTIGWQFLQGRDFLREFGADSTGLVINESAAKFMGLTHPVGETVVWKWWEGDGVMNYRILGVVKDMVMQSPYVDVQPTVFYLKGLNGGVSHINIKINPSLSAAEALAKIETVFKRLIPAAPFDYKFVDEEYAAKFAQEERAGKLASFFTILAIFISCLGLFGLSSFIAEQRRKEIGIRKVLGASVFSLWQLLSNEFVILIIISLGIASPVAYYFMHSWLQNYQYNVGLPWWVFGAAGMGAVLITVLTVSYQGIKAALMNPVRSLRTE